ncbi:terminase small subunit [Gallibacterium genomosp. 3]|uniref:Bacteriophage terminase small subunit n=1 Tax=Gallibacterium genomosp. 3 TaxID=505345 RepID=A0A1A7PVX8_9PAST|nr:terminase small subunit [Gallibacterium genomosp. 3]OBX06194.1 bacteriophage terminase small subunit [Gallibacterium genomosp. 3]
MTKKSGVKSTHSRGLTDKQQRFIEEYLIDLNATQAAIRAGYSEKTARQIGNRMLTNVDIQEAIALAQNNRSQRTEITQDKVLTDLQEYLAICTGKKPLTITTVIKNAQEGTTQAVDNQCFVFEPTGANKAFELLGKHLGMFKDHIDVNSSDGSLSPTIIQLVAPSVEDE